MKPQGGSHLNLAAHVAQLCVHPSARLEQALTRWNPEEVASFLEENKLPLSLLEKWGIPRQSLPETVRERLSAEKKKATRWEKEYALVHSRFEERSIPAVLIKSVGELPSESDNLDVLIPEDKLEEARSSLRQLGYVELRNVEEPHKYLFRKFSAGATLLPLHLHTRVEWVNCFVDEREVLRNSRQSTERRWLCFPRPEESILILTAHWFYEDKCLKLRDVLQLRRCLGAPELDWEYMLHHAHRRGWVHGLALGLLMLSRAEEFLSLEPSLTEKRRLQLEGLLPFILRHYWRRLSSGGTSMPWRISKLFCKGMHYLKTWYDGTISALRKAQETYWLTKYAVLLKLKLRYQPGLLASFSGIDGCGKTTYAQHTVDLLNTCEIRNIYVWSRIGSFSVLKPAVALARKVLGLKKGGNEVIKIHETRRYPASRVLRLWPVVRLAELLVELTLKVRLPLLFRRAVVCDRYIYDAFAEITERFGWSPGSRLYLLLSRLLPRPDLAYLLQASPEAARRRKEEEVREDLKAQEKAYAEIGKRFGLMVRSTEESFERSFHEISQEILEKLYYGKPW